MDTLHLLQQRPHLHEVLKLTYCISDVYAHSIFMSVQTIAWGLQLTITLIMIKSDDYLHNLFIALMVYKMLKVARNSWTLSNLQKYISDLRPSLSTDVTHFSILSCQKKKVKNAHLNFQEPKLTSSNYLFCPTYSPKPREERTAENLLYFLQ